jgi:paraquat-inducible protein B
VVTGKFLSDQEVPSLDVVIHEAFREQVRANSKFWRIPATSVSAGPGVLDVSVEGLAALVQGGIAFDGFDDPGDPAKDADSFVLFANEVAARADSEPLRINFATGRGLLPGKTQLRYLGVPVGFVESLKTENGKVEVSARLEPGHESLRRRGSKFAVVEPHISLQGVYIECVPGTGPITSAVFSGTIAANPDLLERKGFEIRLTSPRTSIRPGANVVYRDIVIGEVTEKSLSEDGQSVVLRAVIDQEYRNLVREKSHFWDAGAIEASIGFLKLKIRSQTLMNSDGKVALDNPAKAGEPVAVGHGFELFKKPLR